MSVNAGAEGSLAGLFSDDAEFTIFSKTFDLFEVSGTPRNLAQHHMSDNISMCVRNVSPGRALAPRGPPIRLGSSGRASLY